MSILQYFTATQPTDKWPNSFDIATYTLTNYRGTGWVMDFPGDNGTHFWLIMESATIVEFGQSNGAFGDPSRQDIFRASTAVSTVDLYVILNAVGSTGQDLFDLLMGGADTLLGSDSTDIMLAGLGSDTVAGAGGADQFIFKGGSHVVTDLGAGGADEFIIGDNTDVTFTVVDDWVAPATTVNQGVTNILTNGFRVDLSAVVDPDGLGFIVSSEGWAAAVQTTGSGLGDTLIGGLVGDVLTGLDGDDTLHGGLGDDTLEGGLGSDTADYGGSTKAITVDLNKTVPQSTGQGKDLLVSIENVTGGDRNDRLTGDVLDNILSGQNGNDQLKGLAGRDVLVGGAGRDTLYGGDGDDTLNGGLGKDIMDGGLGADNFVYSEITDSLTGSQRDTILNFSSAQGDTLDFRDINSPHGFFYDGATAFTQEAGEIIYNRGLLSCDVDGDGKADFQISVVLSDPGASILF